ncbi:DUF3139 domain-containing protein [Rummeliibacillus sp. TYF005]|uniref:DUF3139 domain-containing protein n=1 Tax=Rummeliibacillus sp. TYF005 TaxID=2058214 RepID=UPI000F525246|nr:DUF3139 domain-containing protein [Rummeliibacillus sp. TYF005]RPJ94028.1 DUF3139 domain-containing protein [Rummeliibacillus sp. TYF005]
MALKKGLMLFITAAIVLIIILAFTIYVHFGKQQIYDEALDYLMVNQEYYKSDMKSITVEHSIPGIFLSHKNEWTVKVVFNDEPKARYFYNVSKGKVFQTGWSGSTENDLYLHSESVECGY